MPPSEQYHREMKFTYIHGDTGESRNSFKGMRLIVAIRVENLAKHQRPALWESHNTCGKSSKKNKKKQREIKKKNCNQEVKNMKKLSISKINYYGYAPK